MKSPGPDGIPGDVVKVIAKTIPKEVLQVLNFELARGNFPRHWKAGNLVLIPKPGKVLGQPGSLRPVAGPSAEDSVVAGRSSVMTEPVARRDSVQSCIEVKNNFLIYKIALIFLPN